MSKVATLKHRMAAYPAADKYLLWAVLVLAAVGVVAVYSAISFLAASKLDGDTSFFLQRHVLRVGLALGAMLVFSYIDYRLLARLSKIGLIATLSLLVIVQIVGVTYGGATRWIQIGTFGFQPSDLVKIALILYVAVLLAKKQAYIKSFSRTFVPIFVWILAAAVLVGIEDFSTASILLVSTVLMCFVGRVNVLQLGSLGMVALALGALLLLSSPNRAARVEAYLGVKIFEHTSEEQVFNSQDEGYQAKQARIAFAMGGLTGQGPGKSIQRDFLPAPYNDFIFAIIAEEYGVLGAMALLGVFLVLLFRGFLRIARYAAEPLGLFIAVGLTTMIVLYGLIHAGVSCGLLPVTGLPMPFVSYGGTSMVATGIMVGILLNISRHTRYHSAAA